MGEEVKAHIFEPFFTTKESGKGTGIGLSTVYGIIKQHQGFLDIDSEPGTGTTMKIFFPRVPQGADLNEAGAFPAIPGGDETVLVVEDSDPVRNIEVKILKKLGYRVLEASNGDEALRVSREHAGDIHLLLSDMIMPLMNGRELQLILQGERPGLKVLFVSGYLDDRYQWNEVQKEKIPFLQKPFTHETLAQKVREVLDMEPRQRS